MKKTLIASIVMSALTITLLTGCNNASEPNVINESNLINQTIDVVSNTEPELIPIEATVTTPSEIIIPETTTEVITTEEITTATEETAPQTVTQETKPQTWNETPMDKQTMYVSQGGIYSRIKAIQGSTKISQYSLNDEVQVVARTDTDYYKLSDGNFIHVSFLSSEKTVITTTAATTPAPSNETEEEDLSMFATLGTVPDPEYLATFAQKLFDLTNQERAKYGLPALEQRDDLTAIAQQRAKDISEWYDPEHHRPNGEKWYQMLYRQDMYYGHMGENIAAGQTTPEEMIEAWMNSPVHRKNILTDDFDFLGVGFYFVEYDEDQLYHYYWVQDFYGYYRGD